MLLTRGTGGLYPCPICMIPNDEQMGLSQDSWPLRDMEGIKAIVLNETMTLGAKDLLLKNLGIRNVPVSR